MSVVFGPQSVTQAIGQRTLGPFTIADAVTGFRITVARWSGTGTVALAVQMSFDSGTTWRDVCAIGPVSRLQLSSHGHTGQFLQHDQLWRVCSCGELYVPGHPLNGTTTNHSTYRGQTSDQIARVFPGRLLVEADPSAFHNPDNQPATGQPLRQIRGIATIAVASVTATVTVETLP